MVRHLLAVYPTGFSDVAMMREWVSENAVAARALWTTNGESLLWQDFIDRWQSSTRANWTSTIRDVAVVWDQRPPPAATPVRVIYDAQLGETAVYRLDLTRLPAECRHARLPAPALERAASTFA